MRGAWVLFAREVREKSRVFAMCAVLAALPFLATLLPGARGNRQDTIALVGGFIAAAVGFGLAVALGASTITRDLSEKRMSFYFTRPVSPAAIWTGKAAGALFTSLACFAIVLVPTYLGSGGAWRMRWLAGVEPMLAGAAVIVILFLVSHTISTIVRSRSILIAVDFLCLAAAAAGVYLLLQPLMRGGAADLVAVLAKVLVALFVLVIAVAPVWQLARGRADLRRSHAALSRFLWTAIGAVLLVAAAYVWWVVSVSPSDLAAIDIDQPPRGTRVLVSGGTRNRGEYRAAFVIDRETGRWERLGAMPWATQFSSDGRVVAWLQPAGGIGIRELEIRTSNGPTGLRTSLNGSFVLSHDGSRIAVTKNKTLTVFELASGRMLASAAGLGPFWRRAVFFVTPDLVRVIDPDPLRIRELDVRARTFVQTGTVDVDDSQHSVSVSVSGDGARMLVRGPSLIVDGRSGATIAVLPVPTTFNSVMLHDGSVATIVQGTSLHLYTRDGALRAAVALPKTRLMFVSGETEDGKLLLVAHGGTMYVVDLARAVIEQTIDARGPLPRWSPDPRLVRYAAGQEFVAARKSGLIVWNKAKGRASARPLVASE